jgi:hypothetical protein
LGHDSRRITAEALIIGCCWGADSKFTDVIRGYLAAPTAYVGCRKQPGKTHGATVFPPLLEALASLEPGADLDTRVAALREALDQAAADRPAIKPAQWKADHLSPPPHTRRGVCGPSEPDPARGRPAMGLMPDRLYPRGNRGCQLNCR